MNILERKNVIQAYYRAPWRGQLQLIGLFALVVVVAAIIAGVYLNVTSRAATIGREIQDLQADLLDLRRTNADLETQFAQLTSASTMRARAEALGFVPAQPEAIQYLPVPGYLGRQEAVMASPPGPVVSDHPPLPPEFTETLFDWIHKQLGKSSSVVLGLLP